MRKFPATPIMGVGVLTQALAAAPQQAAARSIDPVSNVCDTDAIAAQETARALLADVLFSLSPAEKRAIAGDRIRLKMPMTKLAAGRNIYTTANNCLVLQHGQPNQTYTHQTIPMTAQKGGTGTHSVGTGCAHMITIQQASAQCAAVKTLAPKVTPPHITPPRITK